MRANCSESLCPPSANGRAHTEGTVALDTKEGQVAAVPSVPVQQLGKVSRRGQRL